MKYDRDEVIRRLIDDKVETVRQWALQDDFCLRSYVDEAENLFAWDDETLACLFKHAFNEEIEEES